MVTIQHNATMGSSGGGGGIIRLTTTHAGRPSPVRRHRGVRQKVNSGRFVVIPLSQAGRRLGSRQGCLCYCSATLARVYSRLCWALS